ncbi:hypothetical protein PPROV_000522200 [Pycnococcus provasolii]|uniref:PET hydrolase/cutinase-like domain-containing protein n=2 Tax=Pycnococcus provasolii TaxID=41880 RepID=A0A830HN56_9CHLO|nr:hypothetical protein PPROV_000522200 [Pycnococcus provasolii]
MTLAEHTDHVIHAEYSSYGTLIATSSSDKTAKVWDAKTGKCTHTFEGHKDAVFTATFNDHADLLLTASYDNTAKVWSLADGECKLTLTGHTNHVNDAAFSPDEEECSMVGVRSSSSNNDNISSLHMAAAVVAIVSLLLLSSFVGVASGDDETNATPSLEEYAALDPTAPNYDSVDDMSSPQMITAASLVRVSTVFSNRTEGMVATPWKMTGGTMRDFSTYSMMAGGVNGQQAGLLREDLNDEKVISVKASPYERLTFSLDNSANEDISSAMSDRIVALHDPDGMDGPHDGGEEPSVPSGRDEAPSRSAPSGGGDDGGDGPPTISRNNLLTFSLNLEAGTRLDSLGVSVEFDDDIGAKATPTVPLNVLSQRLSDSDGDGLWLGVDVWLPMLGSIWNNASVEEIALEEIRGDNANYFLTNLRLTGEGITSMPITYRSIPNQQSSYQSAQASSTYGDVPVQYGSEWNIRAQENEDMITLICEMHMEVAWCRLHASLVQRRGPSWSAAQYTAEGNNNTLNDDDDINPRPFADTMKSYDRVMVDGSSGSTTFGSRISARLVVPMAPGSSGGGASATGGFPIIAFGHGLGTTSRVYRSTIEHLASHGYIVIAPDVRNLLDGVDMLECLRWVAAQSTQPGSLVYGIADAQRMGLTGHSMGGGGAFNAAMLASLDPVLKDTVKAIAPIHPAPLLKADGAVSVPTFITSGTADFSTPAAMITSLAYNHIRVPKIQAVLDGTGHLEQCDGPGELRWTKYLTAWFHLYLNDDADAAGVFWDKWATASGAIGGELSLDSEMADVFADCAETCLSHLSTGVGGPDAIRGTFFWPGAGGGGSSAVSPPAATPTPTSPLPMPPTTTLPSPSPSSPSPISSPETGFNDEYDYIYYEDDEYSDAVDSQTGGRVLTPPSPPTPRSSPLPPQREDDNDYYYDDEDDEPIVPIESGYLTLAVEPEQITLNKRPPNSTNFLYNGLPLFGIDPIMKQSGIINATVTYENEDRSAGPVRVKLFIVNPPAAFDVKIMDNSRSRPLYPGDTAKFDVSIGLKPDATPSPVFGLPVYGDRVQLSAYVVNNDEMTTAGFVNIVGLTGDPLQQ